MRQIREPEPHYGSGLDPVPLLTTLVAVVLSCLPFGSWLGAGDAPAFAFVAVVYWALARPAGLSLISVFLAGLLFDFLSDGPPGMWALVYLIVYLVLSGQNRVDLNAPLVGHWAVCAAAAVGAGLFAWIIGSFYYALFLPFRPLMVHLGLAVAIYPLFALLSGLLPRAAIAGERV